MTIRTAMPSSFIEYEVLSRDGVVIGRRPTHRALVNRSNGLHRRCRILCAAMRLCRARAITGPRMDRLAERKEQSHIDLAVAHRACSAMEIYS